MRKVTSFLIMVAIAITTILSFGGWDLPIPPVPNEVYPLQSGSTIVGIGRAINGRFGTVILNNGSNYVFGWTIKDAWAFACVSAGGANCAQELSKLQGNLVNIKSMRDVANHLVDNHGWKFVAAEALPQSLKLAYMEAATIYSATSLGETMFLVMPAGATNIIMGDYLDALEGMDT